MLNEAQAVGLERQGAEQALDEALKDGIKATEADCHQMGISSVPTGESAVTGAHPQASYKQIFQELMNQAS